MLPSANSVELKRPCNPLNKFKCSVEKKCHQRYVQNKVNRCTPEMKRKPLQLIEDSIGPPSLRKSSMDIIVFTNCPTANWSLLIRPRYEAKRCITRLNLKQMARTGRRTQIEVVKNAKTETNNSKTVLNYQPTNKSETEHAVGSKGIRYELIIHYSTVNVILWDFVICLQGRFLILENNMRPELLLFECTVF